ncbi:hypothetical protein ASPZODRAFT_149267 [Penicilliopsis zonata CBS 506.65]|uniref:Uncharacterized protein n=1 Tax=Penicilliopsis zonata CBS 506.65 TaxID=1073090 RepID=A0A1L9SRE9_9EURO|nr:hypothetical protein ASPZODRAFT_149267 [Penicilliopsis zonata CBS 506.65]OJJ49792.1 hypothetical protein ASPZODRAFT_149267 [Penicilliopsis zonata CBS 506.65]
MWLYRGVQSAVFYYVTCTPCANTLDRRKRKKEAARAKRQQERLNALVTDQPRPFAQPTPFSTNDGWREEIAIGPGPPARRRPGMNYNHNNHNRMESWRTDEGFPDSSAESMPDIILQDKAKSGAKIGDRWHWMRYQREDEPLWGEEVKGSSVGISGRGRADTSHSSKYYIARVPPVNDLHPPIVSGPRSKAETRWMLQPPPSAKVMAGKERIHGPVSQSHLSPSNPSQEQPTSSSSSSSKEQQRLEKKNYQSSPVTISLNSTTTTTTNPADLPRRPPPLTLSSSSKLPLSSQTRDDSCLGSGSPSMVSFPADSIDKWSPTLSWQYPETPSSRPVSKATADSGKFFQAAISKSLSTVQRSETTKKIHMVRLEISDDGEEDLDFGHLERVRPWRWSMDI